MKCKPTPERTQYIEETTLAVDGTLGSPQKQHSSLPVSDSLEDASLKETHKEAASAAESPGHSSDSEPLSTLLKSKGFASGSVHRHQKAAVNEYSDSEDDQPLMTLIKKKTERESATLDAKSPKKRKMTARVSKLRQSPSPSRVKTTQTRGRKGKAEAKRVAPATSTAENQTPKRRGRPKKAVTQAKGRRLTRQSAQATAGLSSTPSSDTSDDEPLSLLVMKKSQPEIKQAVVLLKRMSKSDVMDAIAQGRASSRETSASRAAVATAGGAVESSDEEPLSHKVKRLKRQSKPARGSPAADTSSDDELLVKQVKATQGKNKCRESTNGEEDKQESKQAEEFKADSDDKCLGERKTEEMPLTPHRESSDC